MTTGPSRAERFLAHLDALTGGLEPKLWPVESTKDGLKGVTAIGYQDLPEPGYLLGMTYGLSAAEHRDWVHGKPELSVCVRSDDAAWALAVGFLAEGLRGECPFAYGDLLDFGEPVSHESKMDGFVVFSSAVLEPADARIDLGDELPVDILGMYPTYDVERAYIAERGLEAFWQLEWDPYDVSRPPAV